jgi:hypothetical protein
MNTKIDRSKSCQESEMHMTKVKAATAVAASALAMAVAAPASAAQYLVNFTSSGGDIGSINLTVSGTTATAISGLINGNAITGLSPYASADQQFFAAGPVYFTVGGLSFSDTTNVSYNFTSFPDNANRITNTTIDPEGDGDPTPYALTSISVTAVPEPATWAMMLVGFGMIGFGLRSRRKQSVRVTYA